MQFLTAWAREVSVPNPHIGQRSLVSVSAAEYGLKVYGRCSLYYFYSCSFSVNLKLFPYKSV